MAERLETHNLVKAILGFALYLLLAPALLFIAAGTLNWPMAWVYIILILASTLVSRLIVYKRNPDTLRERARFTESERTEPWDRLLVMIVAVYGPMATMLVAGLDRRFGWSGSAPLAVQWLAALLVAASYSLGVWAMVVNPYFSAVARIQEDRGQVVVKTGPYRIVRHPSYTGAILACLALPFMLGTTWALVPALGMALGVVLRTGLEDRMLRAGLAGYESYAQETRYRLIPGLW
jgi:protein-S-isoprenylcysteine O-methyltransferase Ste14